MRNISAAYADVARNSSYAGDVDAYGSIAAPRAAPRSERYMPAPRPRAPSKKFIWREMLTRDETARRAAGSRF